MLILRCGVNLVDLVCRFLHSGCKLQNLSCSAKSSGTLTNILTNACKHTRSGEIRLGCSLEENPGMLSFFVEDTGPGIPADEAERIFERFVFAVPLS